MNAISQDCTIDPYAFYECPALTTVNMQDAQVVEIGDGAFACTGGAALDFVFPKRMTSEGGDNRSQQSAFRRIPGELWADSGNDCHAAFQSVP